MEKVWEIWPAAKESLTGPVLKSLTTDEYSLLRRLVYQRAIRRGTPKRKAREHVRDLDRRRNGRKDLRRSDPSLFNWKYQSHPILDSLCPSRQKRWRTTSSRRTGVHIDLENFSFIDNPNGTLQKLAEISRSEGKTINSILNFNDLKVLDIGPYVVLGTMHMAMAPFLSGGRISESCQKVIEAVDLRSYLRMASFADYKGSEDVWAFPLQRRHAGGTTTATPAKDISFAKIADELVSTVNSWLGALTLPYELKFDAKVSLNNITTEMLDNAQRHGREEGDGDWYVAGFMSRRNRQAIDPNEHRFDCHLTFMNIGIPIHEAIQATPDEEIKQNLNAYIKMHKSKNLKQSEKTLATLYALQDGVSSRPAGAGGKGMMDMVELTNSLGNTASEAHQPRVSVISGRSCIQFAGLYQTCNNVGEDGLRLQPFNSKMSFSSPPDPNYVYDLDYKFPGTIINLRFSIDNAARKQIDGSD